MNDETETPRTYEVYEQEAAKNSGGWVTHTGFQALARQLERELIQVTKERDALKVAWLEIRQRELRSNGMKVEQARLHAETQLVEAIRALKTEGKS